MKHLLAATIFVLIAAPAWAENLNIDQTPDVFPPPVVGTAPCLVSGSLGVGVTGFGIAGGTAVHSEDCEHRNHAALLATIGEKAAARAYLCQVNEEIRKAFEALGQDCFATELKEQAKSPEELAAYERQIKAQKLLARFKEMDAAKQQENY
jgi:hypothetical protein